jgi:hypothetical protein
MDYLGKGEMLTNRDVKQIRVRVRVRRVMVRVILREIRFLCVWNISVIFYFSL